MQVKIISLIMFLMPLYAKGQQLFFSKRFDFNSSQYENGFDILPYDSGYISWNTSSMDSLSGRCKFLVNFLDSLGNMYQSKVFDHSYGNNFPGGYGTICQTADNGYALAGSIVYPNGNCNIAFWKFSHTGDTLWTKEYGDTLFQAAVQCKQTRDGGFILTGLTKSYSQYGDAFLIKTDSTGNLQWEKHYGGIDKDLGYSVDTCFDGGFIVSGYTWSYGPNSLTDFANAYVFKTDSLGNQIWQKVFGGDYDDQLFRIIQCSDGNYVACGHFTIYDGYQHCCHGWQLLTAMKLDTSGNIIWQKSYGPEWLNSFLFNIKELPTGDFIMSGTVRDTIIFTNQGLAIKIDANGDSLWYRSYASFGPNDNSLFYDINLDKDNGFICTGWFSPQPPDTGTQDIWVLKIDSNGCEIANCITANVERNEAIGNKLELYPNPSKGIFYIETREEIISTEVFTITGNQIIFRKSNDEEVDLSPVASGIYFYKITSKMNRIFQGKLVKE
jgi:hypothetical protein